MQRPARRAPKDWRRHPTRATDSSQLTGADLRTEIPLRTSQSAASPWVTQLPRVLPKCAPRHRSAMSQNRFGKSRWLQDCPVLHQPKCGRTSSPKQAIHGAQSSRSDRWWRPNGSAHPAQRSAPEDSKSIRHHWTGCNRSEHQSPRMHCPDQTQRRATIISWSAKSESRSAGRSLRRGWLSRGMAIYVG